MALCLAVVSTIAIPAAALAAPANDSFSTAVASGSANLGGWNIQGFEPTTLTVFDLNVTAHAKWTGSLTTAVGWNASNVRQGADLGISRTSPIQTGKIDVTWDVTGTLSPLGLFDVNIGTMHLSKDDIDCAPALVGGAYDCTATSGGLTLAKTPGIPTSPYVKLVVEVKFTITPEGAIVSRDALVNGDPALPGADISLTNVPQVETVSIPCSAPVGADASYSLDPYHWTPAITSSQQPAFQIGIMDPIAGVVELPALFDATFGPAIVTHPALDLTGPGHQTELGSILANNVPPVADSGPSMYTGTQRSAIAFTGLNSSSVCGFPTLRWDFSDGGVAFGGLPHHTFQGSGLYSGLLTATDATGLTNTSTFSILVDNAAPITNAGPDTSAAWGKPVAFNGSAVDGADDLATLSYSWSFGDGSPSATGGPSVVHTYAAPGLYTATLTVTDQHGASSSDTRTVTVSQRGVTSSFLGSNGIFDTAGSLSASFADQFGNPVASRTIQFSVDGSVVGSAQTNSAGVATLGYTPAVDAGTHSVSAAFAGDSQFAASTANGSITVDKKATSVSYTGAVSGGPNKVVTLSAVLKDATGKALAGRTIAFNLGTQAVSAVTDASGVAKASLQLNQKNGSYPLTATFAPTGADDLHYTGNASAVTFSLKK